MSEVRWKITKWYLKWNLEHNLIRHLWIIPYLSIFPLVHLFRCIFQQNKYQAWWDIEENYYVKYGGKPRGYMI